MALQDKLKEITDLTNDGIKELYEEDPAKLEDISDLHHEIFNTSYHIIGRYNAIKWLGEDVFDCIEEIKSYEMDNFGEVYTDFSSPEHVVNMYTYIIGEQIINELVKEFLLKEAHNQLQLDF